MADVHVSKILFWVVQSPFIFFLGNNDEYNVVQENRVLWWNLISHTYQIHGSSR